MCNGFDGSNCPVAGQFDGQGRPGEDERIVSHEVNPHPSIPSLSSSHPARQRQEQEQEGMERVVLVLPCADSAARDIGYVSAH